jgi:hypothetical protein
MMESLRSRALAEQEGVQRSLWWCDSYAASASLFTIKEAVFLGEGLAVAGQVREAVLSIA